LDVPTLSAASRIAFAMGSAEASALGAGDLDSEHLVLGLLKIEDILALGAEALPGITEREWEEAGDETREFRDALLRAGIQPKGSRRALRRILHGSASKREKFSGHRTERCRELFAAAERIGSAFWGGATLRPSCLFVAALEQPSSALDLLFSQLGLRKKEVAGSFAGERNADPVRTKEQKGTWGKASTGSGAPTPLIDKIGRDITRLAMEGKIEPAIGRADEIRKIARVLIQKNKNGPLLIGEAGVGKTKIVEGFVLKISAPNAAPQLRGLRVVEITPSALVAGTRYRGEFEERMEKLLTEASSDPSLVLFIDEIHTLVAAGDNVMSAANILKPALARGAFKCIGAATTEEYRRHIEKDDALMRRFQLIQVEEPTREEAVRILQGVRPRFEAHYGVRIPDAVIDKAVELAVRYLPDLRLPDKAVDVVDQACARSVLKTVTAPRHSDGDRAITVEDVAAVVSERCRVPAADLTADELGRLLRMEERLKRRVIGQDPAIAEIAETLRAVRVGIKDPRKPAGVFLLLGATGTGKTELAKALAEFLFHDEGRLVTLDMSEYHDEWSVARLVGAPPGYIGYGDEGHLTRKIRTHPYSVVLLDEIEKAHPKVFDLFLQVFDEGRLTDGQGRRVDFSESVILLTSNLGSAPAAKEVGFLSGNGNADDDNPDGWKEYEGSITQALVDTFRPEFLNRIQKKIVFRPLGRSALRRIVTEKILGKLNAQLKPRGIQTLLAESAVELLLQKGDHERYGARELQRVFDECIAEPLSVMILEGKIRAGQTVACSEQQGEVRFEVKEDPAEENA
jgi:ATP-dependent Clp protease ATP-binding subunit ClpC